MQDFETFFTPLDSDQFSQDCFAHYQIGAHIQAYLHEQDFPDLEQAQLVIIGVSEDRGNPTNKGCGEGVDIIRQHLYRLSQTEPSISIADLGNINIGHSVNDTYSLLTDIATDLISQHITPIFLGGTQDLSFANYMAYEQLGKLIHLCHIDERFDIQQESEHTPMAHSFLSKIILRPNNRLFNLTNIGYQRHFESQSNIDLMQQLYFETYSLSDMRQDISMAESIMRQTDMLSIDISAVRFSDAPGRKNNSPNGFYGEEACQLMRYAGLSPQLSSLGFYEYNPQCDIQQTTAKLIAQMIWYFIEGRSQCIDEHPTYSPQDQFRTYTVSFNSQQQDITFYKSKLTDRWWMQINNTNPVKEAYKSLYFVPCTYQEYQQTLNNDVPERWIKSYQKLM